MTRYEPLAMLCHILRARHHVIRHVETLSPEGLAPVQEAVKPVYQAGIDAGNFTADDIEAARAAARSCG